MEYYKNPEKKSLEQVELVIYDNEVPNIVPALSKNHVEKRQFMRYSKPRIYHQDGTEIIGAKDMWLEMVNYMIQDYEWLLKLPFYRFWSNIVFYYAYVDSLKIVLQESPRFYELDDFPNDEKMKKMLYTLHKKVINIFFRIVINKKNDSEFISDEYHAHLIYEKFLITVPVMIQLSQLFGRENEKIICKIIKKAVKYQPRYKNDFKELVRFSCQVLDEMEEKLLSNQNIKENIEEGNILCISNTDKKSPTDNISCEEIEDMIIYLMDFASSVEIFISVYPPVVEYFSSDYFLMKIISIYENVLPELYRRVEKMIDKHKKKEKYQTIQNYLEIIRLEIIRISRAITFRGIASILEQPDIREATNVKENVDQFLNYLTSTVSDKHLMMDYNQIYPINDDLELIHQITSDIDQIKVSFLKRLISEMPVNYTPKASNNLDNNDVNLLQSVAGPSGVQTVSSTSSSSMTAPNISEVELKSLIYNIKDVMYELGEGFIQKCLQYYNYNTESVINAILEDSLPPEIKRLDRQLPFISLEAEKTSMGLTKDLENLSISDNNETTEDVKQESTNEDEIVEVFHGKRKSKYRNLNDMLNDKSFKNKVAESYSKYSVVEGYDDEYDDTYDSLNDNVILLNDNPNTDKPFSVPRILRINERIEDDEESEDEEQPTTSNVSNNRDNFVQDPAVLRARAEQKRQSYQDRNKRKSKNTEDVVGNPKGQGNDKEVLINRDKKRTNKSSLANHNRRSGAEWKRRQGMIPS